MCTVVCMYVLLYAKTAARAVYSPIRCFRIIREGLTQNKPFNKRKTSTTNNNQNKHNQKPILLPVGKQGPFIYPFLNSNNT